MKELLAHFVNIFTKPALTQIVSVWLYFCAEVCGLLDDPSCRASRWSNTLFFLTLCRIYPPSWVHDAQ